MKNETELRKIYSNQYECPRCNFACKSVYVREYYGDYGRKSRLVKIGFFCSWCGKVIITQKVRCDFYHQLLSEDPANIKINSVLYCPGVKAVQSPAVDIQISQHTVPAGTEESNDRS